MLKTEKEKTIFIGWSQLKSVTENMTRNYVWFILSVSSSFGLWDPKEAFLDSIQGYFMQKFNTFPPSVDFFFFNWDIRP